MDYLCNNLYILFNNHINMIHFISRPTTVVSISIDGGDDISHATIHYKLVHSGEMQLFNCCLLFQLFKCVVSTTSWRGRIRHVGPPLTTH